MHVVPCLYNSFSFTSENINESIVFYDVYAFKEKVIPVYATLQPEPEPAEPEPPSPSSSSPSSSESESESESSSSRSSSSECNDIITTQFHPDVMSQYAISPCCGKATDSLLWIAYIMIHGHERFETIENHYTESNRFKFELVELVRKNKPILKANKLKISGIEETLVHKPFIHPETLQAIALCNNISVCIVDGRKYYEVGGGGGGGGGNATPFIIEKIKGKYVLYASPLHTNTDYLNYIRKNYWFMESISAPIRPMSAYKLQDLVDISVKLNLPIANRIPGKFGSIGTEKRKTKPELYEAICKYV